VGAVVQQHWLPMSPTFWQYGVKSPQFCLQRSMLHDSMGNGKLHLSAGRCNKT
jgi:hypothetical protein